MKKNLMFLPVVIFTVFLCSTAFARAVPTMEEASKKCEKAHLLMEKAERLMDKGEKKIESGRASGDDEMLNHGKRLVKEAEASSRKAENIMAEGEKMSQQAQTIGTCRISIEKGNMLMHQGEMLKNKQMTDEGRKMMESAACLLQD